MRASYSSGEVNDFCTRLDTSRNVLVRRPGKSCCFGFVSHDPLVDQTIQNLGIALGLAIDELLVTCKHAYIAEQNDVVFHAGRYAVDDFLSGERLGRAKRQDHDKTESEPRAHQNVDPKLKKTWKPGNRVLSNPF